MHEDAIYHLSLGEALARLRSQRGWSQRELARRAHVSAGLIAQIESGRITNPGVATIANILHALGLNLLTAEYLLRRRPPRHPQDHILDLFRSLPPKDRLSLLHQLLDAFGNLSP
ncbi:hypothetical protein HRbin10_02222 [bacterium HR10]|nr:hypothetical protein HRbin10_02222 [bacterium HR10]